MISAAGLSAVAPGFQQAQAQVIKNDDGLLEQAGMTAFGNTLKMFQSQVPGAQPMPGQAGMPMTPSPGQASMPQQPSMAQGPMQGGAPPTGSPQLPPMPQQPMQQGGGMPMAGGQQQPEGRLDWRQISQKVTQANPGAPPQVIASAVNKFLPLMNAQAQQEWKQISMALAAQRANTGTAEAARKQEQGDQRIEQGNQRIEQGTERLDLSRDEADRRTRQGDTRLQQGADKVEISKDEAARRREQGDKRIGQGDKRLEQGDKRLDQSRTQAERRENDRALDRVLKQKKDALVSELQRERNAIFAASMGVPPAKLKTSLDAAQKRHDEAVARLDKEFGGGAQQAPATGNAPTLPPAALKSLKEGQITNFNNGTSWTLENGRPKQVGKEDPAALPPGAQPMEGRLPERLTPRGDMSQRALAREYTEGQDSMMPPEEAYTPRQRIKQGEFGPQFSMPTREGMTDINYHKNLASLQAMTGKISGNDARLVDQNYKRFKQMSGEEQLGWVMRTVGPPPIPGGRSITDASREEREKFGVWNKANIDKIIGALISGDGFVNPPRQ